jgi:hypothetical protein
VLESVRVEPTVVKILRTGEGDETEQQSLDATQQRLEELVSAYIEQTTLPDGPAHPKAENGSTPGADTDLMNRWFGAHAFIADQFEDGEDLTLSVDLTGAGRLTAFAFLAAATTTVRQHPTRRSALDLFAITHETGTVKRTVSVRASLLDEGRRHDTTRTETTHDQVAIGYLRRDLETRLDRIEESWTAVERAQGSTPTLDAEVRPALTEARDTVAGLDHDLGLETVHALEQVAFRLGGCADELAEQDVDEPASAQFETAVGRFEMALSTLRAAVREHRQTLSRGKVQQRPVAEQPQQLINSTVTPANSTADETGDVTVHRIPLPPGGQEIDRDSIQADLLRVLDSSGPFASVSKLATAVAAFRDDTYDESYRSKIQYNARTLAERGYLRRTQVGRGYRTSLSVMGWVWLRTNVE